MAQYYLLVRRLADGLTTAFQPYWLRRRGYLRFDKKGVEFGWCEDRDWLCIWFASPEKLSSSTWQKEVNAEVLYLDSWTLEIL